MTVEMNVSDKSPTLSSEQTADQTSLEEALEQKMQASMASFHAMPKNETARRVMYESALDFFHVAVAGERHLWCSYPTYLVHFMRLFILPEADWRHLSDLKQKSNEALESCHICIKEYHAALSLVPLQRISIETPESLKTLVRALDDLDAERLVSKMVRFSEQTDAQMDMDFMRTMKLIVYEILAFPYLLRREVVYAQFCTLIHFMCLTGKKFQLKTILPGLLLCLFLPQRSIRTWSSLNFRKRIDQGDTMDPDDPVINCLLTELHGILSSGLPNTQPNEGFLPVVTVDGVHDRYKITNQATEFLQSLSLALSVLSAKALYHLALATDMLVDLIKYLTKGVQADIFWPALQAISVLISKFKSDLWKDPMRPSPALLLDLIISNMALFESVLNTTVDSNCELNLERLSDDILSCPVRLQCFCWMSDYLESLVEHAQFALFFRRLVLFLARDLVSTPPIAGSVTYIQSKWYALSLALYFVRLPTSSQTVRMALGDLELSHVLLSDLITAERSHPTLCRLSSSLVQACIEMDSLALYRLYMGCFDPTVVSTLKVSYEWTNFWLFLASVPPHCLPMHVHNGIMDLFVAFSLMGAPKNDPVFRQLVAANQQQESLASALVGVDAVVNFLTLFLGQVERHCDNNELRRIYQDPSMVQAILCFTIHFDERLRSAATRLFNKVTGCSGRLVHLLTFFSQHASHHCLDSVCHIFERYVKWTRMSVPMFCFVVRLSELAHAALEAVFLSTAASSPAPLHDHPDRLARLGRLFHCIWYFGFDVLSKCFSTWKPFDTQELLPLMMASLALLTKLVQLYQSHALLVSVSRMTPSPEPSLFDASLGPSTVDVPFSFSKNGSWFPLLLECATFAHRHEAEPMRRLLLELMQGIFQFWTHAKVEIDSRAIRYCKIFLSSRMAKLAESSVSDATLRNENRLETAMQDSVRKACRDYETSLGLSLFGLSESTQSSSIHSKRHVAPVAATANVLTFYNPLIPSSDTSLQAQRKPSVGARKPVSAPTVGSSQVSTGGKLQQIKSSIMKDMTSLAMSNRVAHVPLNSLKRSSAVHFSKNNSKTCPSASNSDTSGTDDEHDNDDKEDEDDTMDSLVCSFKRKPEEIDLDDRSNHAASLPATKNRLLEQTAASKSIKVIDDPKVKRSAASIPYLAKKELPHASSRIVTRALLKPAVSLDVSSFQRAILSWNYQELNDKNVGLVSENKTMALSMVPDRFESYDQYATVFEPLLLFECRAQILKSKEELCYPSMSNDYGVFHLNSVAMTDDFHDVQFGFDSHAPSPPLTTTTTTAASDLSKSTAKPPSKSTLLDGFPFVEHDYLYLEPKELMSASVGASQEGQYKSLFQPAIKTNKYVTAIVTGVGVKLGQVVLSVRMYIGPMDPRHVVSEFRDRTEWHVIKVCNLVTVYREYMALSQLPTYPLFPCIVDPVKLDKGSPLLAPELAQRVPRIASFFKVNDSQALAIAASFHHPSPFVLIQGPPGTGKTTTILSMISYHIALRRSTRTGTSGSSGGAGIGKLTNTRVAHITTATSPMPSVDRNCRKPLLVCAPSNAAVDEIVKRLVRDGIVTFDPNPARSPSDTSVRIKPNVVRIGSLDMIHEDVKPYTLDHLMDKEANAIKHVPSRSGPEVIAVQEELALLRRALDGLDGSGPRLQISPEEDIYGIAHLKVPELLRRKKALQYIETERRVTSKKTVDTARSTLRMKILNEADIICSTLSGSGHDMLAKWEGQSGLGFGIAFDTVIIDEACQCVELSSLIPLRYGAQRCILVGDPNQLPPTVLSQTAQGFAYEQSIFNRIQAVMPDVVYLLSVQYRMHPEISHFPSQYFYQGRLENGPDLALTTQRDWHRFEHLRPFLFFHVPGNEARGTATTSMTSLMNAMEADMAVALVFLLCHACPQINFAGKIGIISPYKQQVREIKRRLLQSFRTKPHVLLKNIDVSTVDGFQGQEKEVIIFSCVRASTGGSIGFLSDARRMNVALTRAKCSLFVLGNADALKEHPIWRAMIQNATDKHQYIDYNAKFWHQQQSNARPTNLLTL